MKEQNVIVNWGLMLFAVAIVVINAALSFAFGYQYLGQAFGISGWLAPIVGGLYAILVADLAFLIWFWAYRRVAETGTQRSLSKVIGGFSLALSIAMSVNQLAVNSYGLVDLSAYHAGVGFVALTAMILVTALHIIGLAIFVLADADEKMKSKAIDIRATLIDETVMGVEATMDDIRNDVVKELQNKVRRDVLFQMGQLPSENGSGSKSRFQRNSKKAEAKAK
jgi:hypothetical protein